MATTIPMIFTRGGVRQDNIQWTDQAHYEEMISYGYEDAIKFYRQEEVNCAKLRRKLEMEVDKRVIWAKTNTGV